MVTEMSKTGPIPALSDLVVATSLLSKAIRRGQRHYAEAAATALAMNAPHRLIRAVVRIAAAEIGLANLPLVVIVLDHAGTGFNRLGAETVVGLVGQLTVSPKCHGAADLMSVARDSPLVSLMRKHVADKCARDRVVISLCREHSLEERAVAARFLAAGPRGDDLCRRTRRDSDSFFTLLSVAGRDDRAALAKRLFEFDRSETSVGLCLLLGLPRELEAAIACEVPVECLIGGAPSYAFDEKTLVGAWALTLAAKEDAEFKAWLKHAVRWWEHRIEALAFLLHQVEGRATSRWCPTATTAKLAVRRAIGHRSIRREMLRDGIELMRVKIGAINSYRDRAYHMRLTPEMVYDARRFSGSPGSLSFPKFMELDDGDA